MLYRHIIGNSLSHALKDDASEKGYSSLLQRSRPLLMSFKERREKGAFDLLTLPQKQDDLKAMAQVAAHISGSFAQLVILGTGGSALNGQALTSLANPSGHPRLYFMDNVDPYSVDLLLNSLDIANTAFLCISKSGKTVETLAQMLICIERVEQSVGKAKAGRQFFVISDPVDNPIRRLGDAINATQLDHEPNIGGRFATFTNVALLPAMVAGLDASAFRSGAETVLQDHLYAQSDDAPEAAKGAALAISLMDQGYTISVMMPYIDRLAHFASWYRQMWAESLGKNGHGTTPVKAMGTIDQHSQLQLYLDGPRNKTVTFIALDTKGKGARVTDNLDDSALSYLAGKTLGDIIAAEQQATEDTLVLQGCPVRRFALDKLDEEVMGAMIMHFMLETIIAAELLGINAYDQPAVEAGKILTRKLLAEGGV